MKAALAEQGLRDILQDFIMIFYHIPTTIIRFSKLTKLYKVFELKIVLVLLQHKTYLKPESY